MVPKPQIFVAQIEKKIGIEFPFYINDAQFDDFKFRCDIYVEYHPKARFTCECGQENLPIQQKHPRVIQSIDLLNYATYIHLNMPSVCCPKCGIKTVPLSWVERGSKLTTLLESRVLAFSSIMPISLVTKTLGINYSTVMRVVKKGVNTAQEKLDYSDVQQIGMDEKSTLKHHHYITIFLDMLERNLLYATHGKDSSAVERFCNYFKTKSGDPDNITDVSIDMSPTYISATDKYFPNANITFDKFHVIQMVNTAIDKVRRMEVRTQPILKGTRHMFLKDENKLKKYEIERLCIFSKKNLKTARVYRYKLSVLEIYASDLTPEQATIAFKKLISWGKRSRLEPLIEFAKTLEAHLEGIVMYFKSRLTQGAVEGMNSRIEAIKRRSRGFANTGNLIYMLYLTLSGLEIPKLFSIGLPKIE
jgi:transposase